MTNAGFQEDSNALAKLQIRGANWSRFWKSGTVHAVDAGKDADASNPLIQFWQAEFGQPNFSGRVLDIGTGNGGIPRLLIGQLEASAPLCDAVDLSDISPDWWVQNHSVPGHDKLSFHGNTRAEELPFADGSFQHIYSQFGIEYTDLKKSVPELLRVLQPTGSVRLIVHHPNSLLLQVAKEEFEHLQSVLAKDGLLACAQSILEPIYRAQSPEGIAQLKADPTANLAKKRFNQAQDDVSRRLASAAYPDVLQESRDCVARAVMMVQRRDLQGGRELLQQWLAELQDNQMRLEEIQSHALDVAGVEQLCADLTAGGGKTETTTLFRDASVLAWVVRLDR